jgi:hypothetical protein
VNVHTRTCWTAGQRHTRLVDSLQNHKNRESLYRTHTVESVRIGQNVYKYRAFYIV